VIELAKSKMYKKHVLINERQEKKLKELVELTGNSEAVIIRMAIDRLKV